MVPVMLCCLLIAVLYINVYLISFDATSILLIWNPDEPFDLIQIIFVSYERCIRAFSLFLYYSAEDTLKKQIVEGSNKPRSTPEKSDETTHVVAAIKTTPTATDYKKLEQQNSKEKRKAYEDAFLEQMNEYIRSGEVES